MYRIRQREQIVPNFHIMEFEVPWSVNKIKPGQFVIVMSDEKAERIPFTISDWDAEKNSVTIIFMETGWSTKRLAKLNAADELSHVAGPLGMPSKIEKHGHVVLAGGCYGIGGIYPIARAMKEAGNKVTCMIEGRDEIMLYWRDKLR
ncbi:MAG: sulfide/dihydroorotate dehydrogenase-like FAD/NAD-binding protein, partial [Planctomycetes bacterium]|nr:sulfide/dihydroorotate dehydrogenase-like FAD/NAD-binding protein [Planctomycetota bacterium]